MASIAPRSLLVSKVAQRLLFSFFFVSAGCVHFVMPEYYAARLPQWVPWPHAVVYAAGVGEILAGAASAIARLRAISSLALAAFIAMVVFVNIVFLFRTDGHTALTWLRVAFLASLCGWALHNSRS